MTEEKKPQFLFTITTAGKLLDAIRKYEAMSNSDLQKLPEQMLKDGTAQILGTSDMDAAALTESLREEGLTVKNIQEDLSKEVVKCCGCGAEVKKLEARAMEGKLYTCKKCWDELNSWSKE